MKEFLVCGSICVEDLTDATFENICGSTFLNLNESNIFLEEKLMKV